MRRDKTVAPSLPDEFITLKADYRVPAEALEFSEEIKKSRFLTYLAHVQHKEQMREWLLTLRREHTGARHHCWACVAGEPWDGQQYGFSDDGEPAGTAGKPLLNLLLGSGLGEIGVVVVRYYGGVKLGTGGLVRAYSNGGSNLLQRMMTRTIVASAPFLLECQYEDLSVSQHLFTHLDCDDVQYEYGAVIRVTGCCPLVHRSELATALTNRSHGRIALRWL
jgi:uncharacterized YigZ family protein